MNSIAIRDLTAWEIEEVTGAGFFSWLGDMAQAFWDWLTSANVEVQLQVDQNGQITGGSITFSWEGSSSD